VTTSLLLLLLGGGGLIGFLLAVLGAGGSILLLPLLVSGAALPTREAVPLSLLVVTLMALGNLGPYLKRRQVAPKPALVLGLPALAGSWMGGSWVKAGYVSEPVQLGLFAAAAAPDAAAGAPPPPPPPPSEARLKHARLFLGVAARLLSGGFGNAAVSAMYGDNSLAQLWSATVAALRALLGPHPVPGTVVLHVSALRIDLSFCARRLCAANVRSLVLMFLIEF
jgi:uncharacterized membrane protein YfcA